MTKRAFAAVLLFLVFPLAADGQIARALTDGKRTIELPAPGEIIIELATEPVLARAPGSPVAAAEIESLLDRLERDVDSIERARVPRVASAAPRRVLRHRFSRTFAGASARVAPETLAEIRKLEYVRAIHPDRIQKAMLQESVEQVGAPAMWRDHGARGEGVMVAIIDSGIDYRHPAFGGNFGIGFKVRNGRDFVNDDGDPMDDNGHGTHVAGIVAANGGGLVGVAPDATLLAYKVLDHSGSGRDSFVMAAVEEAARVRPDIVNMSLGRAAVPDDPVVAAIENAAATGIVFVVAAGNTGQFLDIGSPGNTPAVITVGAIDRNGQPAPFSSKGPVVPTGLMKPEVMAPGVDIVSAREGGGTRVASGTSMASPHVAGVAALLRDLHPEWTQAMIRAAIIDAARPIAAEVMAAGAGAVHAVDASRVRLIPSATEISFGISDRTQNPWRVTRRVTVTNRSDAQRTFAVAIDGLREGIEITPSASSIALDPGASAELTLDLSLDHAKVPAPELGSLSFGGFVRVSSDDNAIAIPWSLVKASRVRARWSGNGYASVRVATDHMMVRGETSRQSPSTDLFIGAGAISAWVEGRDGERVFHIIRDEIDLPATGELTFSAADAPHRITFSGADANGRLLSDRGPLSSRDLVITHPRFEGDLFGSLVYLGSNEQLFVSSLPSATKIMVFERAFDRDPRVTWVAQYETLSGIDRAVELKIAPERWKSLTARGVVPDGIENAYQSIAAAVWMETPSRSIGSFASIEDEPAAAGGTAIEAWATSPVDEDWTTSVVVEIGGGATSEAFFNSAELIAEFSAVGGGLVAGHDRVARISSRVIGSREPIAIGEGPAHPTASIASFESQLFGSINWSGPLGETRLYDAKRTTARLYDPAGNVVATFDGAPSIPGVGIGPSPGLQLFAPLPRPGAYILEASASSFRVAGRVARGTLRATLDTSKIDAMPPTITSLRIDDGSGRTTATIGMRSGASLMFSGVDVAGFGFGDLDRDRTAVHFRLHGQGDESWTPLAAHVVADDLDRGFVGFMPGVFPDGVLYRVDLSALPATMKGAVDVRITLADDAENTTTYTIEPALVIAAGRRRIAP